MINQNQNSSSAFYKPLRYTAAEKDVSPESFAFYLNGGSTTNYAGQQKTGGSFGSLGGRDNANDVSAAEFGASMGLPSSFLGSAAISTVGNAGTIGNISNDKADKENLRTKVSHRSGKDFNKLSKSYKIAGLGSTGIALADLAFDVYADLNDDNRLGIETAKNVSEFAVGEAVSKAVAYATVTALGATTAAGVGPVIIGALVATAVSEIASRGIDWLYDDMASGNFERRMESKVQKMLQEEQFRQGTDQNKPWTSAEAVQYYQKNFSSLGIGI